MAKLKSIRTVLLISLPALLIGCSTSLSEKSPFDIASQSIRRTDTLSGTTEVLAPQIRKFASNQSSIQGQLQLRSAGPFTDDNGKVHRDGAFLDILLNYNTATPNPDEALMFKTASWPGGEAALIAGSGESILDCTEEARQIYRAPTHYSRYTRGGRYGGHYTGYGDGYGYGNGYGLYGGTGYYGGYGGYRYPGGIGGYYGGGNGGTDHDDDTDSDTDTGTNTDVMTDTSAGTTDVSVDTPRRPRRPRIDVREPGEAGDTVVRPRRPRTGPKPNVRNRVRPSKPTVSRPKPISRSKPVSRSKSSSRRSAADRVFRNTNNSRTRARSTVTTNMKYDPHNLAGQYASTDYVVNYSCQRQESLRVFVPNERLLSAERNGLLLYVRPNNGIEETVVLPPNYIKGFLMAAYGSPPNTAE